NSRHDFVPPRWSTLCCEYRGNGLPWEPEWPVQAGIRWGKRPSPVFSTCGKNGESCEGCAAGKSYTRQGRAGCLDFVNIACHRFCRSRAGLRLELQWYDFAASQVSKSRPVAPGVDVRTQEQRRLWYPTLAA